MTLPVLPPTTEPLIDENSFATISWLSFFDSVSSGDLGVSWTPSFVGLTEVGAAIKTGKYYRLSKKIVYFIITITPGTNTSATAGTTYCDNFPLQFASQGASCSIIGSAAVLAGVTSTDKRIYTGTWSLITTPVTLAGIVEVSA